MGKHRIFIKHIALPQDHGSWVFIISPLMIGIISAGRFNLGTLSLIIATMAAFLLRQPAAIVVKAYSGRRPRSDLPAASFWFCLYGLITLLGLISLFQLGYGYIAWVAVPGILIFSWHLWLVGKRSERRQIGVEIIATGILALAAPAAYWIGLDRVDSMGWWLWLLVWFQNAASIVYAYLRLEQRVQTENPNRKERWKSGERAFLYTTFNLIVPFSLGWIGILPRWIFLSSLVQWLETIWGIEKPATGWTPTRIGIRQLIVSILWTILFIITWRLQ